MQDENGRRPHPYDKDDAAAMVQLGHKINEQASNKIDVDEVHLHPACAMMLLCRHEQSVICVPRRQHDTCYMFL